MIWAITNYVIIKHIMYKYIKLNMMPSIKVELKKKTAITIRMFSYILSRATSLLSVALLIRMVKLSGTAVEVKTLASNLDPVEKKIFTKEYVCLSFFTKGHF